MKLPLTGEWSLDDIKAHLPEKPKYWADRALVRLVKVCEHQIAVKRIHVAAVDCLLNEAMAILTAAKVPEDRIPEIKRRLETYAQAAKDGA